MLSIRLVDPRLDPGSDQDWTSILLNAVPSLAFAQRGPAADGTGRARISSARMMSCGSRPRGEAPDRRSEVHAIEETGDGLRSGTLTRDCCRPPEPRRGTLMTRRPDGVLQLGADQKAEARTEPLLETPCRWSVSRCSFSSLALGARGRGIIVGIGDGGGSCAEGVVSSEYCGECTRRRWASCSVGCQLVLAAVSSTLLDAPGALAGKK